MQDLAGMREGKKRLEITKRRRENIIKIALHVVRRRDVDWTELSIGSVAGCCESCNEPSGSIRYGDFVIC